MRDKPWVTVQLQSAPPDYRRELVKHSCGVGTTFDFNVTLKSMEYNTPIPMGEYVFSYEARAPGYDNQVPWSAAVTEA